MTSTRYTWFFGFLACGLVACSGTDGENQGSGGSGSSSSGGDASSTGSGSGQSGSGSSGSGSGSSGSGGGSSSSSGSGGGAPQPVSAACAGLNNGSGTTIPCAATLDGKAVCFSGTTPITLTYEGGAEITGVKQVTGQGFTTAACVLLDTGAVHCGMHTNISKTPAIASGATMVSGGLNHACAIVGKDVKCWGGDIAQEATFNGEAAVQLACYYHGCCAVTDAGKMYCWGENNGGMHGTGDQTAHPNPTSPKTVPGKALYVGPGQDHMCAVFEGGKVQCWGQDWNKQCGGLGASNDPGVTLVQSGAVAVYGGQFHTCVLFETGEVQCVGQNQTEGAGLNAAVLTPVAGISTGTAISTGKHYSCARLADSTVSCWGTISGGSATPAAISNLKTRSCD